MKESDEERFKRLDSMRKGAKVVSYSALYGVGKDKLSREASLSKKEAKDLLEAFWKMNWAVVTVSNNTKIKEIEKEKWVYNPVSGLYYNLRNTKDIWSTLNQGTGVYVFDSWVGEVRKKRPQLTAQFHDEIVLELKKGLREKCRKLLSTSMERVNKALGLNVEIKIDVQFGDTYASVH